MSGRLAENVVRFVDVLRRAGLSIGSAQTLDALAALAAIDMTRRDEFYWALHAVLVKRRDQHALFDLAFRIVFRDPLGLEAAMAMLLPRMQQRSDLRPPGTRRLSEAVTPPSPPRPPERVEVEPALVQLTPSDVEVLRTRDFEQMSADEIARAQALIRELPLTRLAIPSRRLAIARRGERLALRATLRASLRGGGQGLVLRFQQRTTRPPALVVLCDISGSMERYARVLLHFVHTLMRDRDRVHAFVFGTQLTPVSRELGARDVDQALFAVGHKATDWSGGTKIASALRAFNRRWARRLLASGAIVLLVTDGLERDEHADLAFEADRLHRSCRRLIWLNPLLRYAGFEARAAGIRALLPHVDEHRPCHNLESLEGLVTALSTTPRETGRRLAARKLS